MNLFYALNNYQIHVVERNNRSQNIEKTPEGVKIR